MSEPTPGTARSQREAAFFDAIGDQQPEAWWGHRTPAGALRAARRARMVCDGAAIEPGQRVLELGCGAGFFATQYWQLIPAGARVTAVDISARLVEHARSRPELADCTLIDFEVGNAEQLPFPDGHFDAVIGSSILHHLQLELALPELLRVLRSGGRFSFAEPNMANPDVYLARHLEWYRRRTQTSEDETAFTRQQLARLLTGAGLIDVVVTPFDFLHPKTPRILIKPVRAVGSLCERIPFLRAISGSLHGEGRKP